MAEENSSGLGMGMGILIGLVLLMVILAVFYFLGRPGAGTTPAPQTAPTTGDNIIEVPDQIDVNVDDANPAQ